MHHKCAPNSLSVVLLFHTGQKRVGAVLSEERLYSGITGPYSKERLYFDTVHENDFIMRLQRERLYLEAPPQTLFLNPG
jgi:hypothetical protein